MFSIGLFAVKLFCTKYSLCKHRLFVFNNQELTNSSIVLPKIYLFFIYLFTRFSFIFWFICCKIVLRGLFCTLMFLQTPAICLRQTGIANRRIGLPNIAIVECAPKSKKSSDDSADDDDDDNHRHGNVKVNKRKSSY